jgi:hypothetical protein
MRSISYRFELAPGEELRHFRAHNLRQALQTDYEDLARSDVALACSIKSFALRREASHGPQAVSAIASMYQKHASQASGADPISASFIESSLLVYDRMLAVPHIRDLILQAEEVWGKSSPLSHINKLHRILNRCKNTEDILVCVAGLSDMLRTGSVIASEVTLTYLSGARRAEKGMLDLLLGKRDLMESITQYLQHHKLDADSVSRCQKMGAISGYRALFGSGMAGTDLTWMGALRPSGRRLSL